MGGLSMEEMICQGCGSIIQTTHPEDPGYTPKSSLKNEVVLCQRCFRVKHYNDIQDVNVTDDDFLKMVGTIRKKRGLIVHIFDLFDVKGNLMNSLIRITSDKNNILVGNKVNLLPKYINKNQLNKWIRSIANEAGLQVKDVFLISSVKGQGIDYLIEQIENYRNKKHVYV